MDQHHASKRRKLDVPSDKSSTHEVICSEIVPSLSTYERPVSPPLAWSKKQQVHQLDATVSGTVTLKPGLIASPFKLNRILDLPESSNVDTVTLSDLLGDPLIKECWQFNYLFDIDLLMNSFDEDVQSSVEVKVVHGFWRRDDPRRGRLEEATKCYRNVQLISAYMPESFGTHHSKMMILFRHDDTAEVIIHTANIIRQDWEILSQAVWRSSQLGLKVSSADDICDDKDRHIGTGTRFGEDLLRYLQEYGESRTGRLTDQLQRYDFSNVQAALIASVPGRYPFAVSAAESAAEQTSWGWLGLRQILETIPSSSENVDQPVIAVQISSIATFNDPWIKMFTECLQRSNGKSPRRAAIHIIFPTADEIRRSVGGYQSGDSIHMKITSAAQMRQLSSVRPMLCHWAGDVENQTKASSPREAGRRRAAPHIKTYVRFTDESMDRIDWAMITSANLSTQAWGALPKAKSVRVCSWEIGVVVWPQLFGEAAKMVPTFKTDNPCIENLSDKSVVGFRMPYDLPLVRYKGGELPWSATSNHLEPDWKGVVWRV